MNNVEKDNESYAINPQFFTLHNDLRTTVRIMDWGATIVDMIVYVPSNDEQRSIILHTNYYKFNLQHAYMGATIGRVANRIKNGTFTINKIDYHVPPAYIGDKHSLHSGNCGYDKRRFKVLNQTRSTITMSLFSPDGDQGFPGDLNLVVTYKLTNNNELIIQYYATTNKETPVNITNHAYWNLETKVNVTCDQVCVKDHTLKINANEYLPVDVNGLPIGKKYKVSEHHLFDFRTETKLRERIDELSTSEIQNGFDHPYILNHSKNEPDVTLISSDKKVKLEMLTDYPATHVYTANFLSNEPGCMPNKRFSDHAAISFEPEYYPNFMNEPSFRKVCPNLKPHEEYNKFIYFKVTTV